MKNIFALILVCVLGCSSTSFGEEIFRGSATVGGTPVFGDNASYTGGEIKMLSPNYIGYRTFTATGNGTYTKAKFWRPGTNDSTTNIKIIIARASDDVVIGVTSPITLGDEGLKELTFLSSVALTSGQQYKLGLLGDDYMRVLTPLTGLSSLDYVAFTYSSGDPTTVGYGGAVEDLAPFTIYMDN